VESVNYLFFVDTALRGGFLEIMECFDVPIPDVIHIENMESSIKPVINLAIETKKKNKELIKKNQD